MTIDMSDLSVEDNTMAELQAAYTTVTGLEAPKFSTKTAAYERIAKELEKVAPEQDDISLEGDIIAYNAALKSGELMKDPPKKPGRPKSKPRIYEFSEIDENSEKFKGMAKQARDILMHTGLENAGRVSEDDLKIRMQQLSDEGLLNTKQSPWRIFQYYRAEMIYAGWVKMSNDS